MNDEHTVNDEVQETPVTQAIGRTSATERDPTTSDKFRFWLPPRVIVNPFDIVAVEQISRPARPTAW
jgi:hypothetical protein